MERVTIFIDGSNFYHGVKENIKKTNIDFMKFAQKLCGKRQLCGVYYYNAPLKKEFNFEQYKTQQKFFNYIQNLPGFNLKLGHLEFREILIEKEKIILESLDGQFYEVDTIDEVKKLCKRENTIFWGRISPTKYPIEKGVDILLACDMLSLAYNDAYDTAILVSGDGDFAYVIKNIKLLNKKVEVAYFPKRRCWHLRQVSDKFIPLENAFFEDLIKEK
ncbi:MAG: NYN domain-containing protein [Candidatus Omnitrophica bacterium]|nr:NYN domain-containing protein [Candidatus Omnitrophota bacterium]